MLNLLIDGAVPFGYTTDVNDSDFLYADEHISVAAMNWQNLQNPARQAPLPDVILSNTPPPSPLRRAHSYLTLFPEKPQEHLPPTLPLQDLDAPVTSSQGDESVSTRAVSTGELMDGKERVRTGLEHIEEVRRRLRCDPVQPHHDLPSLSWPLPHLRHRLQHKREGKCNKEEEKGDQGERQSKRGESKINEVEKESIHGGEKKGHEESRWRSIGGDLRKIADQFQLNNAKAGTKSEGPLLLAPTRYITTFIFSLLRLVSTLQQAPLLSEDVTVTRMSFFTSLASLWTFVRVFRNLTS